MKKIKFSYYNELIPVENTGEYLLYNIYSGGLNVLENRLGKKLQEIASLPGYYPSDFPEYEQELINLHNLGFFTDYDADEVKQYQDNYYQNQMQKFSGNAHIGVTIGTTITCNMGCPYCFEVVKPNKSLRDVNVVKGMVKFMEDMIHRAPVKQWASFSITWYGGEPLINKDAIRLLSEHFIPLCEKHNIPFSASIITNGILLDKENWFFLKNNGVTDVQVTIDGAKEVHEAYRPLKNAKGKNYDKILENLSIMPLGMNTNIRINTDKRVAATLPQLLSDLQSYGIWPQRHDSVSIKLAWLRSYKNADTAAMSFLSQEEFFQTEYEFSRMLAERYNTWSGNAGKPQARLKWKFPQKQSDCATYVSPYFFTFDPEGNIHKCWETVHDSNIASGKTVFDGWNATDYKRYLDYSRTNVHPTCYNCKFNPVCEGLSCAYDSLNSIPEGHFPCTPWKTQLPAYFKKMYTLMREHSDLVTIASPKGAEHQTHANK